ncbi:MAG TPA: hypothetical protein VFU47_10660 [Armatimonadota bacterium]|nr:hypothetical protein [Armatimonadota bacterium]
MLDLSALRTYSIHERESKVRVEDFAPTPAPLHGILERLPAILAGNDLRTVVRAIAEARRRDRPVVLTMGAHVIKCGLARVVIELMRRGVITALASNGATLIHDSEIALFGKTSENVEGSLGAGRFGWARETAEFLNSAIAEGSGAGLGVAVGQALLRAEAPYRDASVLAQAAALGIPFTIHAALGTDILHMHPGADGAAIGAGSLRDFRTLTEALSRLGDGGVLINFGSAVIIPEVVLKAFSVLRNLDVSLAGCVSVDVDMIRHYRGGKQLVERIGGLGGRGYALTGHHEIMLPLIAGLVLAALEDA